VLRAIQAKQPEADVKLTSFPKGKKSTTLFWTLGVMLPKYSENKDAAIDFMLKGLLDPEAVQMSQVDNYKIVPFKSAQKKLQDSGKLPAWAPPLLALLDNSDPIPCNQYFLTVEQPIYKEEIEKMLLSNQSVDATLKNLKDRIAKGVAEVK
jgi:ABC-type glycerol-3-phosphate transport system substrate-binding protein